jgi:hypothetical protein
VIGLALIGGHPAGPEPQTEPAIAAASTAPTAAPRLNDSNPGLMGQLALGPSGDSLAERVDRFTIDDTVRRALARLHAGPYAR